MNESLLIALQLLLAHILTDFVLQTKKLIKHKNKKKAKSWMLYLHGFLAGFLTYLLLQRWDEFLIPAVIAVTHFAIDLWKLYQKDDSLKIFLLDQGFHLLVLLGCWIYLSPLRPELLDRFIDLTTNTAFLALVLGYLLVIYPIGFIIGKATQRWQKELAKEDSLGSLKQAGRVIGVFERVLIVTLILTDNFGAIGFLIAAKSILRFSDAKAGNARKQAEYVLIGTLMSFALSIIVGILMRVLIF